MKEVKPISEECEGILKIGSVRIFVLEPGETFPPKDEGISKDEFHAILDKASQPIDKKEDIDDSK